MKNILVTIVLSMWYLLAFGSDTTILFRPIAFSNLFGVAKNEHKVVMLYFHFDGCGACVKMEKTAFKNKDVIEYYNSNFINFDINTKKGEGIEINKLYNVQLHPTYLFLDESGNELHRLVGLYSPEEFLTQANNVILTNRTLTDYKRVYTDGNRNPDFLFEFSYMLRNAAILDSVIVNQYLDALDPKDYFLEKNLRYIYEFSIHNFQIFMPFNNPRFEFLYQNRSKFDAYFDKDQVATRIVWILNNAIYHSIERKDDVLFKKAIEMLKEFDTGEQYLFKEMDGRVTGIISSKNLVLSAMLTFYEKSADKTNYLKTLEVYISKIWNNADELNTFAWGVYEQSEEEESDKINTAIKCSIRSIELNNNYANNDTYAWLLYKSGNREKALEQAKKTVDIAMKNNDDYSETQKLVDLINKY